jgi:predicted nucleic acid-binding protein
VILLDTNVLIDGYLYFFDPAESYVASMLSRAELELGVQGERSLVVRQERQVRLARLDARVTWRPFDRAASQGYGAVAGHASVTGARLRSKDALIAGQAYSLGCTIMTRNTADFAPFAAFVQTIEPVLKPPA